MDAGFQPGPLMARTYALARGPRVNLRLARPRDEASIQRLIMRTGALHGDLDVARLVRFDPRRHAVICAMALIDGSETVVGVGKIAVDADEPALLIVDRERCDGLEDLLSACLRALRSARAA